MIKREQASKFDQLKQKRMLQASAATTRMMTILTKHILSNQKTTIIT